MTGPPDADPTEPGVAQGNQTLVEVIAELEALGYRGQLVPLEGGRIRCGHCHDTFAAADVEVRERRRTEGPTDPSDMAAVMGITCPCCGTGGTLVAGYGPDASAEEADVLAALSPVDLGPPST